MTDNEKRALRVADLMLIYAQRVGAEDEPRETNFRDLLVDAMHYCALYAIDFAYEMESARMHYDEEVFEQEATGK